MNVFNFHEACIKPDLRQRGRSGPSSPRAGEPVHEDKGLMADTHPATVGDAEKPI